jgi:membrane fusion protein, multidrug efflux system
MNDGPSEHSAQTQSAPSEAVMHEPKSRAPAEAKPADQSSQQHQWIAALPAPSAAPLQSPRRRKWLSVLGIIVGLAVGAYFLIPWVITALNTVSTDDAYVNGHVTLVAARVSGQVTKVLVDDNWRVKTGDVLVQLDKEPYQIQVNIKNAALLAAERELASAKAQARSQVAQARGNRFKFEHAIEEVKNQVANLGALVATLNSRKATLELARDNFKRGEELVSSGGISKEELDQRRQTVKVDGAAVEQALQTVYAARAGLGLPIQPPKGHDLAETPADLDQNFSTVREALANAFQSAALLGYLPASWEETPNQAVADFYKQDKEGNLNRIYDRLVQDAPAVKLAEANVMQARANLAQAELNLRYCDVLSDIDGQVTRRNVNPGNNVQAGQSLMAVRSLTEIWIDANFKETQLADLRIGQRARLDVDMYGNRHTYEGRITGFTMGTGQTLALLPPQNATGNFVKIVQRLPVRIEPVNYDPEKDPPLFVGLSVTPYVYFKEPPTGPNAGDVLRPDVPLPKGQVP